MLTSIRPTVTNKLKSIAVLMACSLLLQAEAPKGWFIAGSKPAEYESGVDAFLSSCRPRFQFVELLSRLVDDFGVRHGFPKGAAIRPIVG